MLTGQETDYRIIESGDDGGREDAPDARHQYLMVPFEGQCEHRSVRTRQGNDQGAVARRTRARAICDERRECRFHAR